MKPIDVNATIDAIKTLTTARMHSADVKIAWEYLTHAIARFDRELAEYIRGAA